MMFTTAKWAHKAIDAIDGDAHMVASAPGPDGAEEGELYPARS